MKYPLNVPTPRSFSYVKRNIPEVTVEQRERALKATHYNEFAFPAVLCVELHDGVGCGGRAGEKIHHYRI